MRRIILATIALHCTLVIPAAAQTAPLEGVNEFKFDMSLQDVQAITQLQGPLLRMGAYYYQSLDTHSIAGQNFHYEFFFKNKRLDAISLRTVTRGNDHLCLKNFQTILDSLTQIYGKPKDTLPPGFDKNFNDVYNLRQANFIFPGQTGIMFVMQTMSNECTGTVAYIRAGKPTTF